MVRVNGVMINKKINCLKLLERKLLRAQLFLLHWHQDRGLTQDFQEYCLTISLEDMVCYASP